MSFQPSALQRAQFTVETIPGTIVAADKLFHSVVFDIDPKRPTTEARQAGNMFPVNNVPGKGHEEANLKGDVSVQDIIYLLSTLLINPSFSQVAGSVYQAVFAPLSNAVNSKKTLSIEKGIDGAGNGFKFPYAALTDFELDITPEKQVAFTGKMIGQKRTTGITLTSPYTELSDSILFPTLADLYLATSEAGLGAGQIKPAKAKLKFAKGLGDVKLLSSADLSFSELVQLMPNLTVDLTFPKTSATDGYLAAIDSGTVYYLEVKLRGALIATISGVDYYQQLVFRMPIQWTNPGEGEDQGVQSATFTANAIHTASFNSNAGGAIKVTAQSTLTTL